MSSRLIARSKEMALIDWISSSIASAGSASARSESCSGASSAVSFPTVTLVSYEPTRLKARVNTPLTMGSKGHCAFSRSDSCVPCVGKAGFARVVCAKYRHNVDLVRTSVSLASLNDVWNCGRCVAYRIRCCALRESIAHSRSERRH